MHKAVRLIRGNWGRVVIMLVLVGVIAAIFAARNPGMLHEGGLSTARVAAQAPSLPAISATPRSTASTVDAQCATNTSGKLLLVSIAQQHLWACDGSQLAYESAVTTGASAIANVDDATPTGTWHIYGKHTNTTLRGCDVNGCWNDPVAYWMPFDGSVGFHDASWQTFAFGGAAYTTDGSHGCVHLPIATAAWVYNWAPIGTTVTVRA